MQLKTRRLQCPVKKLNDLITVIQIEEITIETTIIQRDNSIIETKIKKQ